MKRLIAALVIMLGLLKPVMAHGVKDPVCRMEVDTHATAYQATYKSQTYYFCSSACKERFKAGPETYVKTLEDLSKKDTVFDIQTKTSALPVSGKPVNLTFTVISGADKTPVKDFEIVHEQLMHLVLVSEDLDCFAHEHPTQNQDGTFDFVWTFPHGGRYWLYTDFTPKTGDNQLLRSVIDVKGTPKTRTALTADTVLSKTAGDYRISLKIELTPVQIEKSVTLTYSVRDAKGQPVTDMEPYLGAMGHLFALHQSGEEVIHTHTVSKMSDGHEHQHQTGPTSNEKGSTGPDFVFKLEFPKEGLYKVWAQFARRGRVVTVPFVIEARPICEKRVQN